MLRQTFKEVVAIVMWIGVITLAAVVVIMSSMGSTVREIAVDTIRNSAQAEVKNVAQEAVQKETTSSEAKNVGYPKTKDVVQSIQAVAAAIGIVGAAGWGLYVFVLGRSSAGTIQIRIEQKQLEVTTSGKVAIVSVGVKNVGRTMVEKQRVNIRIRPLDEAEPRLFTLVEAPLPELELPNPETRIKTYALFVGTFDHLEPGEDAVEDVLVSFDGYNRAKVEVIFVGWLYTLFKRESSTDDEEGSNLRRTWYSRRILDVVGKVDQKNEPEEAQEE